MSSALGHLEEEDEAADPPNGFLSPPPHQRRAHGGGGEPEGGEPDSGEADGDDGAPPPGGPGRPTPTDSDLALDELIKLARRDAHPPAKTFWRSSKKLVESDDVAVKPDWYLELCAEGSWPPEVHEFYNDPSRRGGAKPHVIHLRPHTCGHPNSNAAKRCLHAKDCPCKFGELNSTLDKRADAGMLKLHATETAGKHFTLTVGMVARHAGWCHRFPGDGSAERCDGVPMGTNNAYLQEKAVLEIARSQLDALRGSTAQRVESRKRSRQLAALDRAGGLGSAGLGSDALGGAGLGGAGLGGAGLGDDDDDDDDDDNSN